ATQNPASEGGREEVRRSRTGSSHETQRLTGSPRARCTHRGRADKEWSAHRADRKRQRPDVLSQRIGGAVANHSRGTTPYRRRAESIANADHNRRSYRLAAVRQLRVVHQLGAVLGSGKRRSTAGTGGWGRSVPNRGSAWHGRQGSEGAEQSHGSGQSTN